MGLNGRRQAAFNRNKLPLAPPRRIPHILVLLELHVVQLAVLAFHLEDVHALHDVAGVGVDVDLAARAKAR